MSASGIRLGPDGFGFELIAKRIEPAFYLDITNRERKPPAFFDLIAQPFGFGHSRTCFVTGSTNQLF
jgi:hypothetical protein